MPSDSLPMVRVVRKRGQIEEICVGPSMGKVIVLIAAIIAAAALLLADVVKWSDIASTASLIRLW